MGEHHPAVTPRAQRLAERVAEDMYRRDHATRRSASGSSCGPGHAELTMTVRRDMLQRSAICHGGFIFTLADSAFAYACNSYNLSTVASGCSIEFLAPSRGRRCSPPRRQRTRRAHRRLRHRGVQPARREDRAVPRQELPDQGSRDRGAAAA